MNVLELAGVRAPNGRPLDVSLARGEAVALWAGGGSGKRWILRTAAGLRDPGPGSVRCAAARVAYVFASGGLVFNMSAVDNVTLPLRFAGLPASEARARAGDVLAGLGLAEVAALRPSALSEEARQLVQLARAMALRADLLFLEDPFRPLSADTAAAVAAWLRGELDAERVSVLMSCTDRHDGERVGARILAMER
ncbi:MAG: ATP-binding cassette domain-containing protein [Myxococcota bacterium]